MSSFKDQVMERIQKELKIIGDKTGVNPKIILGILGGAVILSLINLFAPYITCLVGIVLPTYWSLKAIETKEADDDTQWLTYWIVYACFTFLDLFVGFILKIIPFYFFLKLIFLVWCFMPNTRGAVTIYNKALKPIFQKYEGFIDKTITKATKKADKLMQKAKGTYEENKDKLKDTGKKVMDQANDMLKKSE